MPNDIRVLVRPYGGGPTVDYSDVACPTLSFSGKSDGGDADIQWVQKTNATPGLYVPDPYSVVSLIDVATGREFRRFRTCPWQVANWDCTYSGILTVQGEGLAASLQDHTFGEINSSTHTGSVFFGQTLVKNLRLDPTDILKQRLIPNSPALAQAPDVPILALSPEKSIWYAVGMLCSDVSLGSLATTGIVFTRPSRDFLLSNALQVIDDMSAVLGYLALPMKWHVRSGVLDWLPQDTAPKYQVSLEDGASLSNLRFDPKQIRNRAHIGFGKSQVATWPDPLLGGIDHSRIPITRDMPVHLGGEINEYGTALQLAGGVLAQAQAPTNGWNYTLTIPRACPIIEIATGQRVKPHLVQEGHGIRILGLGGERLSPHVANQPPMVHYMSEVRFDNGSGILTVTCGETKAQAQGTATRGVVQAGHNSLANASLDLWQVTRADYDGSKIEFGGPVIGPSVSDYTYSHIPVTPKPTNIGTIAPIDSIPPQMMPPMPPPGSFYPLIPLAIDETGPPLGTPPCLVTGWEIYCNVATTAAFKFVLMSTGAELFTASASGGVTTPAGVVTTVRFTDPPTGQGPVNVNPGPGRIVRLDHSDAIGFVCTTEDTNPAITWLVIVLRFERLFPGYGNTSRDEETREPVFDPTDVGHPLGEDLA